MAGKPGQTIGAKGQHADAGLTGRFLADERGATAIEYALIAGGIGAAVASVIYGVGSEVKTNLYDRLAAMFQ